MRIRAMYCFGVILAALSWTWPVLAGSSGGSGLQGRKAECAALDAAIQDLIAESGLDYPDGKRYLAKLAAMEGIEFKARPFNLVQGQFLGSSINGGSFGSAMLKNADEATGRESNAKEAYLFTSFRGNGEDGLHLAYSYGLVISKDLKNWTDVSDKLEFPQGSRHGTILEVSSRILDKLIGKK